MNIHCSRKSRGFAVIIALVAVTVLTILAGAFAYSMKIDTRLEANSNNGEQMLWLGRAGVEYACWGLAQEGNQPWTSLEQYWNGGPGDGPETNGPLATIADPYKNIKIGHGTVSISMTELESKININTANGPLLQRVLNAMGVDASDISVVSDSIQDWIDSDDMTRPAGAESDYYQGLTPPYYAKNAPMDDISELLLVKGVTPAMFDGSGQQGDHDTPFPQHKLGFGHAPGQEKYDICLTNLFTPFSDGKINILTAKKDVLTALFDNGDPNATIANKIIELRESDPPLRSVNQLAAAGVSPQDLQQLSRYLDFRGDTYQVVVTAKMGEIEHQYTAIVYRHGAHVQVFSFYQSK